MEGVVYLCDTPSILGLSIEYSNRNDLDTWFIRIECECVSVVIQRQVSND